MENLAGNNISQYLLQVLLYVRKVILRKVQLS